MNFQFIFIIIKNEAFLEYLLTLNTPHGKCSSTSRTNFNALSFVSNIYIVFPSEKYEEKRKNN